MHTDTYSMANFIELYILRIVSLVVNDERPLTGNL